MTTSVADSLRASLHELKRTMRDAARVAAARFEEQTGLSVRSIDVDFERVEISSYGDDWPSYQSTQRHVRVELYDFDVDDE